MAYEIPGFKIGTLYAAADLTGRQYTFVTVDNTGKIAACDATTVPIGVLQNKPDAGEIAEVMMTGVTKLVSSGTIAAGVKAASDANGKVVAAATAKPSVGIVLEGGAANEILTVAINCVPNFVET